MNQRSWKEDESESKSTMILKKTIPQSEHSRAEDHCHLHCLAVFFFQEVTSCKIRPQSPLPTVGVQEVEYVFWGQYN